MYPAIDPIIHLGPLSLHWYGLTMTLAIFLGALVASRYVGRHGQDPNFIWDMLLWVLIPAIIGARLYFVFIQSPRTPYGASDGLGYYLANPIEILEIWKGGIHIYGAFIFGGIALFLYMRWKKLPLPVYFDGVGLGLLLGQAIGRIGNFINQELYGPPTTLPWGLRIDQAHRIGPYTDMTAYPDSTRFHPLFLYELLWDALGFVLLLWISRRFAKRLRPGDLALLYLIWAPLGRFFIEFLRTDSWFFPGTPFNVAHILTGTAVIASTITLIVRHRHAPAPETLVQDEASDTATPIPSDTEAQPADSTPVSITTETETLASTPTADTTEDVDSIPTSSETKTPDDVSAPVETASTMSDPNLEEPHSQLPQEDGTKIDTLKAGSREPDR